APKPRSDLRLRGGQGDGLYRQRPTGWRQISPASQSGCAAMPAMWIGVAPIRQASGNLKRGAWAVDLQAFSRAPSIQKPMCDAAIAINTAVAKERPVAAYVFKIFQIALANQDFFFVMRRFHDDPS